MPTLILLARRRARVMRQWRNAARGVFRIGGGRRGGPISSCMRRELLPGAVKNQIYLRSAVAGGNLM